MKIFISPMQKPTWQINSDNLKEGILKHWKNNSKINTIDNPERAYVMEWEIVNDNAILEGRLDKEKVLIVVESNDNSTMLNFIIWSKRYFPDPAEIIIYDEDYTFNFPIEQVTRELIDQLM